MAYGMAFELQIHKKNGAVDEGRKDEEARLLYEAMTRGFGSWWCLGDFVDSFDCAGLFLCPVDWRSFTHFGYYCAAFIP